MKKLLAIALAAMTGGLFAATVTWTGKAGTSDWGTAGNWDSGTVPGTDDDIVISSGDVVYTAGDDLRINGTLTISGSGSFVQAGGDSWMQGSGTITVSNGGSFSMGTCEQVTSGLTIVINGGTFSPCELGTVAATIQMVSGKYLVTAGEFQPPAGFVANAGEWITPLISPRGIFTLGGGSLTLTKVAYDGFYKNAGCAVDLPAGASTVVTVPAAVADVYNKYFSNGKFTVGGQTLSQTEFEEQIIVEAVDAADFPDGGDSSDYSSFHLASVSAYRLSSSNASNVTATGATISTSVSKTEGTATVYALWGTSEEDTSAPEDWDNSTSLGTAVEGDSYTLPLSGLTEDVTVYYAFVIVADGAVVAATDVKSFLPSAYTAVFTGAESTAWATAGNWRSGAVPTTADRILIPAGTTCEHTANLSFSTYDITIDGGSLTTTGEINPGPRTVNNGSLTALLFSSPNGPIVVRGSTITSTTPGHRQDVPCGFWGAGAQLNFRSGAPCTYIFNYTNSAPTVETVFQQLFTNGRIIVDGDTLTDASRVTITIGEMDENTEIGTVTVVLLETQVTASFDSASTATPAGISATLSVTVDVSGDKPLYLLSGADPANLSETLIESQTTDDTTYTATISGAEGTLVYWQFRLGEANDSAAVHDAQPQRFFATANGNVWNGGISTSASTPGNWSKGTIPAANEPVYVVEDLAQRNLEWNLVDATVGSWKQLGNVLVIFDTTTNAPLTVVGDVTLEGGTWVHSRSAAGNPPATAVNVEVGGDMTVAAGVSINAGTGAFDDRTYSRGFGPEQGPGYLAGIGASFAGEGAHNAQSNITDAVSYGSVLDPLSYGSGGLGDNANYAGGGIVKLVVEGMLTVNGTICSRGFGWNILSYAAGSGGSVNITAGALEGAGRIDADGGNNGPLGPGAGGRVKVALTNANATFDGFTGTIRAFGGSLENETQATTYDMVPGAAGTVCLIAGNAAPVVKVYNEWRNGDNVVAWRVSTTEGAVPSATHLPVKQDGDAAAALKTTEWELSGHGAIRLTRDVTIAKLTIKSNDGSQLVYADGYTLKVASLTVDGVTQKKGEYTADDVSWIVGEGSVVVGKSGLALILR